MATEGSRFFFSYAREDSEIVLRLARELRKAGGNVWLDQLDIRGGSRWDEAVQAALESCRGLVAVLSPSSVASQNFLDEVSYALEEQKQVIPLLYRECAIPFRLRRVQYVNLTINYDDGFAELLRSMGLERATEVSEPPAVPASRQAVNPTPPVLTEREQNEPVPAPKEREIPETPRPFIASGDTERPLSRAQRAYKILGPRGTAALAGAVGGSILGILSYLLFYSGEKKDWLMIGLFSGLLWTIAGFAAGTNRRRIAVVLLAALVGGFIPYRLQGYYSTGVLFNALAFGAPLGATFFGAIAILFISFIGMIYKKLS